MKKQIISILFLTIFFINGNSNSQELELINFSIAEESFEYMVGEIKLSNLPKIKRRYQLTINGYRNHPSNLILKNHYTTTKDGQGYYDFKKVFSNKNGQLEAHFKTKLPPGNYRVKFLVKDIKNNWLTVFWEDDVHFEIKTNARKVSGNSEFISIKQVQELLNRAGYNAGTVDGILGNKTKNAIRAFQKDRGYPVTGKISKELLYQLK